MRVQGRAKGSTKHNPLMWRYVTSAEEFSMYRVKAKEFTAKELRDLKRKYPFCEFRVANA